MVNLYFDLNADELSDVGGGSDYSGKFSVVQTPKGTLLTFGGGGPTIIVGFDGSLSTKAQGGGWMTTRIT
jgi:hypothetical protein